MTFFDVLIRNRGDIEATLKELRWDFRRYAKFRASPDFDEKFRIAHEIIASKTFASHRKYGNVKMPDIELKLFDTMEKRRMVDVESRPSFTINIIKDSDGDG